MDDIGQNDQSFQVPVGSFAKGAWWHQPPSLSPRASVLKSPGMPVGDASTIPTPLKLLRASLRLRGKKLACNVGEHRGRGFDPWVRKTPWRRKWQLTLVFFPGKSHGQRNLASYSPWDLKESDTTERTAQNR